MENGIFNIAVIGTSGMGRRHIKGVLANPNARVYAICDLEQSQLDLAQEIVEYPIPVITQDYKTLLGDKNLDAVILVVPDPVHKEMVCAFLRDGKAVLCEKPMALSMEDCEEMMRVEKETGGMLMIGQVARFTPAYIMAKELVDEGRIGDLYFVESEYAHSYTIHPGVHNWRITPERNGFIGGGCHAVDLLRWIAGNPTEVMAYSNHKCLTDWPADDCTIGIYKFPNGVIGKVFASIGCSRNYTMRTCLYGTKGTIICGYGMPEITIYEGEGFLENGALAFTKPTKIPVELKSHNVGSELEVFLEALVEGKPAPVPSIEGASTVAVCTTTVRSAHEGRPLPIIYPTV